MNLNKTQLAGRLTRDVELRYTGKGTAVTDVSLAINRVTRDESGNRQENTTFVDVTLWGRTAELAGQYLQKGSPVYIEGHLELETWDDRQTGQKRSRLKVTGESLQFFPSNTRTHNQQPQQQQPAAQQPSQPTHNTDFDDDEDIPF